MRSSTKQASRWSTIERESEVRKTVSMRFCDVITDDFGMNHWIFVGDKSNSFTTACA